MKILSALFLIMVMFFQGAGEEPGPKMKITCPSGDQYVCYTVLGHHVYKGEGLATIEFE